MTSELEERVRSVYSSALAARRDVWERNKLQSRQRMAELAELDHQNDKGNGSMHTWFSEREEQMTGLQLTSSQAEGVSQILDYVEQALLFPEVEANLQVRRCTVVQGITNTVENGCKNHWI